MENIEAYWEIANKTIAIINIMVEGWLVYRFVKPFINRKSYCVGVSYSFRSHLDLVSFHLVKIIEYLPIYVIAKDGVCFQRSECESRRCFCVNKKQAAWTFPGSRMSGGHPLCADRSGT